MSGKLYTYPDNFRAQKIQIAAKYSKFNLDLPDFVVGETDKSADFLKKFPLGKVPAFENDKVCLFEPNAIAYYVGNKQTRGGDNEAEVLQWIGVADNDILPAACTWVYPTMGIMQYNKNSTEKAKNDVKKVMEAMNQHLLTRTYLVGERISQADISVVCNLKMLYTHVMDSAFRSAYPNVNRWFMTCVNQFEFKNVLGKVTMCEKMAQFDGKKYNEIYGKDKKDAGKKEKKPAQPKAKKEQKPKEEKKVEAAPAPKKNTDPWANSPPATMDMDAWKRTYSNETDNDKVMAYFNEHFPKDTYSVWQGNYKYNEELAQKFMASNMIGGMFQRVEKLRKHAFASVLIFGENYKYEIEGIWIWRGHDLVFPLCEDWTVDYETYDWKKLDYDAPETQLKIKEFFAQEGGFDGRKLAGGKVYK
jgi:elongation factor 1-gamma